MRFGSPVALHFPDLQLLRGVVRDPQGNTCGEVKPVGENPLRTAGQESLIAHLETGVANAVRPRDYCVQRGVGGSQPPGIDPQPALSPANGEG